MSSTTNTIELIDREAIENFLYYELELLDEWKLMEWASLFAEDGLYLVPTMNNTSTDYKSSLYIIADDFGRIKERAIRLLKKETHIEYPHSKTRHLVTNVRIFEVKDEVAHVNCNFVVYRSKREVMDPYVGQYQYKFRLQDGNLKIVEKRVLLSMDSLRPQGKVSIVL